MELIIPGPCVPKARPRVTFKYGRAITYTPARSKQYAEQLKAIAINEYNKKNLAPIAYPKPVKVRLEFVHTRKRTGTPDIANCIAQCLDAIERVAYENDSQVVELTAVQYQGKNPMTRILID